MSWCLREEPQGQQGEGGARGRAGGAGGFPEEGGGTGGGAQTGETLFVDAVNGDTQAMQGPWSSKRQLTVVLVCKTVRDAFVAERIEGMRAQTPSDSMRSQRCIEEYLACAQGAQGQAKPNLIQGPLLQGTWKDVPVPPDSDGDDEKTSLRCMRKHNVSSRAARAPCSVVAS